MCVPVHRSVCVCVCVFRKNLHSGLRSTIYRHAENIDFDLWIFDPFPDKEHLSLAWASKLGIQHGFPSFHRKVFVE